MAARHQNTYFLILTTQVLLILLLSTTCLSAGDCRFGPKCVFQCRCASGRCSSTTGECEGNDDTCASGQPYNNVSPAEESFRWHGAGCQIGNVAYKKPTGQTGVYGGMTSERAVDGRLPGAPLDCAHPDRLGAGPASWYVDLGEPHLVYSVTMFNTYNEYGARRLVGISVIVSNTAINATAVTEQCGYIQDQVPRYTGWRKEGNITVTCPMPLVGRYVTLARKEGFQTDKMTLCEVVVMGHKYIDCSACSGVCSPVVGCSECSPGKMLPDCKDCPSGSYGADCAGSCSDGCTGPCDTASGVCECKTRRYGEKCTESCSTGCASPYTCHSISGVCDSGCTIGRYGEKCSESCSAGCVSPKSCHRTSGACDEGCQQWYILDNCALKISQPSLNGVALLFSDVTEHSVKVTWNQAKDVTAGTEGHVGYLIRYAKSTSDLNNVRYYKDTAPVVHTLDDTHSIKVDGLESNTEYYFKVRTFRVWTRQAPGPEKDRDYGYISKIASKRTTAGSATSSPTSPPTVRTQPPTTPTTLRTKAPTPAPATPATPAPTAPTTPRVRTPASAIPTVQAPTPAPTTPAPTASAAATSPISGTPVVGTSSEDVGVIVGAVLGAIAITVLVIIAVLLLLRHRGLIAGFPACLKREKNSKLSTEDIVVHHPTAKPFVAVKPIFPNGHQNQAFSDDVDHGGDTSALESTPVALLPPPTADRTSVAVEDLQTYVDNKKHSPQDMVTEYGKLPKEDHKKCKAAEKPENKPKNRFVNIHAYEHSRVMLEKIDGDPLSDYINANYVKGYKDKEKAYIATQGPKPNTIPDLWRMVWEKKANRIVMVTRLVENNRIKSEVYWPLKNGSSERYGDITVTMEGMETYTDYCIRILGVECEGEMRLVRQFHFSSWPDKQKPEHAFHLLAFRRKINSFSKAKTGPMIVHCSAGVGRTGTYIGIDYLLEQAEAEGKVDIFTHVSYMRRERMNMVQTRDQYVFVHEALVEALKSGDTSMPCSDFEADFARICREPKEKPEIERQFEVLCELKTPVLTEKMTGMNSKNKAKNRSLDTVPDDRLRPYLTTRYKEGTDYINATYLESFKAHGAYLATQAPLLSTIVDFWRLIHDHNCRTIIMLNELDEEDEECPIYWPTKDEPDQTYGPLHVKLVKEEAVDGSPFIARDLRLSLADSKSSGDEDDEDSKDKGSDQGSLIRQYQVTKWSKDEDVPANPSVLLDLLDHQQKWQQSLPAIGLSRTAVHCLNGASRSGLFCTASFMLDKMKVDQEVDVFLAARYITCRRDGAIHTQEQYTFLHQLANACMSRFQTYANFQ